MFRIIYRPCGLSTFIGLMAWELTRAVSNFEASIFVWTPIELVLGCSFSFFPIGDCFVFFYFGKNGNLDRYCCSGLSILALMPRLYLMYCC